MLVGVISDTHDDVENTKKAIGIFKNKKVDIVLHLGDYVAPPIVRLFQGLKLIGIYGNNDGFKDGLNKAFKEIEGELKGDFAELELDKSNIALYHGTERKISEALAKSGNYDIVLTGHNHIPEIINFGKTLLLNPGSPHKLFQHNTKPSVGILDTKTKKFEHINI